MAQPATAGIIVAAIFVLLAVLYFGYRGYVKWHRYRSKPIDSELPPIREPIGPYSASSGGYTNPTPSYGGDTWRTAGSASKGSFQGGTGSIYGQLSPDFGPTSRRQSFGAFPGASDSPDSIPGSPYSMGPEVQIPLAAAAATTSGSTRPSPETLAHHRMSSASTMTLKRTYAGSVYKGSSSMSPSSSMTLPQKRESYLPHSPYNRDSIQIVPPQPLGVGFGSMATATDERTLAFSKSSGIGLGDDTFSQGLVWGGESAQKDGARPTDPTHSASPSLDGRGPSSPVATSQPPQSSSTHVNSGSLGHQQLRRYLQEGPSRANSGRLDSLNGNESKPSWSVADNSGNLPEPIAETEAGPLATNPSTQRTDWSSERGGPGFTSQQSPLHALSLGTTGQSASPSRLQPAHTQYRQGSPLSHKATTTAESSPILASFPEHPNPSPARIHERGPSASSDSNGTPGLASRSGSGTAGSDSNNGSPASVGDEGGDPGIGRRLMLGKDGNLTFGGEQASQTQV